MYRGRDVGEGVDPVRDEEGGERVRRVHHPAFDLVEGVGCRVVDIESEGLGGVFFRVSGLGIRV